MHITDYGLWFYCAEEDMYFEDPKEYIAHVASKPLADEQICLKNICSIVYNGDTIRTGAPIKYYPEGQRLSIEINRAKSIKDAQLLEELDRRFNLTKIYQARDRLGQTLILQYRMA